MKRWERARVALHCGGLHGEMELIPKGAPVLVITTGTRPLYRCVACAGSAPPDLPAPVPDLTVSQILQRWPLEEPPLPEPEDWSAVLLRWG